MAKSMSKRGQSGPNNKSRKKSSSKKIAAKNLAESGLTTSDDSSKPTKKTTEDKPNKKPVNKKRKKGSTGKKKKSQNTQDKLKSKMVSEVNKKQKSASAIYALSSEVYSNIKGFFSFGIPWLDKICGGGASKGAPKGRIIEIFGWEGSGKTAILEELIVDCLRKNGIAVMFEPETALEKHRLRQKLIEQTDLYKDVASSLDDWLLKREENPDHPDPLDDILYSPADTVEDIFTEIETMVDVIKKEDPERPVIFGWDSVAATTTDVEQKADVGQQQYSKQAIIISRALRKIRRKIADTGVSIALLNQLRSKVNEQNARGSEDYETFGGKAIRFYSTIRISLKKVGKVKLKKGKDIEKESKTKAAAKRAKQKVDGILIEAETVKNKIFGVPPFQRARFPIMFDEAGISAERSALLYLKEKNMTESAGNNGRRIIGIEDDYFTEETWPEYYKRHADEIEEAFFRSDEEELAREELEEDD